MKNMSFFLTTRQVREGTKTVTRRLGWAFLKPGEIVCAIVKGQGIPKGGKMERIRLIQCVSNRPERLNTLCDHLHTMPRPLLYTQEQAQEECRREGFPDLTPKEFVQMFAKHNACDGCLTINRIEFRYVRPKIYCSSPGCGFPDGRPCIGCGKVVTPKTQEFVPI